MTSKRNRFYQIWFVASILVIVGLLAFMGITAVQKSMRLNISFSSTPNVVCCIGVKKTLETPNYTPIFDNKANQIAGGVRLSGNSLIFDDTRFSNSVLGGEYYLSFTNYSDTGSAIILTFSNANVNGVQPYQYIVTSGGMVDGLAITQANSMRINMQKCVEVTLNTIGVELNTDYENTIISQDGHYYQNASEDLNIKLKSSSGYAEPPKIDSIQINGSLYEANLDGNNTLTIPANAINGDITINTSAVELLGVSLSGLSNCTSSNANTQIAPNSTYSTTITPNTNYSLPETITVKQGGVTLNTNQYSWDSTTGQLSIPSVTGNIEITCVAIMQGYNITYVMNDVDSPVAAPRKTSYVEGETLSYSALPNKTNGAEFLGWTYTGENVEPLEEPTLNLTLPNTTTGDLTLTAHWGSTMQDGYTLFNTFHQAFFSHSEYKSDEIMGEYIESYSNLDGLIFDFWNAEYEEEFGNYKSGSRINDVLGDIRVFKREPYTLCILSPNKIYANTYADSLCANFYLSGFDQYHNNISTIIFNNFDTSKVSNMEGMFNRCSGLQSLDLSSFDTSKVSNMRYMFYSCSSLTSLNVNNFNTSSVTDMRYMFQNCSSLTSLDLSSFNTTNVTNMSNMFYNCLGLKTIYVSNGWSTANVTSSSSMFNRCTSLPNFNPSVVDKTMAYGGGSGYLTLIGNPLNPGNPND